MCICEMNELIIVIKEILALLCFPVYLCPCICQNSLSCKLQKLKSKWLRQKVIYDS